MSFPADDSPDDTAPQVMHPAATEALVTATRALVTTQRTADAPDDVLRPHRIEIGERLAADRVPVHHRDRPVDEAPPAADPARPCAARSTPIPDRR